MIYFNFFILLFIDLGSWSGERKYIYGFKVNFSNVGFLVFIVYLEIYSQELLVNLARYLLCTQYTNSMSLTF